MKLRNTMRNLLTAMFAMVFVLGIGAHSSNAQNVTIDFSTSAPNQVISAPAGVTVSQFQVSAGTISYNSFSTTFGGTPFAESSAGWTATDPLAAKNFYFTITADDGVTFDLTAASALVRSTNAGPSDMALIINSDLISTVATPNSATPVLSVSGSGLTEYMGLTSATIRVAGYAGGSRTSTGGGAARVGQIQATLSIDLGSEPTLLSLENSLTFVYPEGSGPSNPKSTSISGSALDGTDISVSATSNFEVSKESSSGFGDSVTLSYSGDELTSTPIYARLKEGLLQGDYETDEKLTVSGGSASSIEISLTGKVVEAFKVPYSNSFSDATATTLAQDQGFNIPNLDQRGGYLKLDINQFVESPAINFTEYLGLRVKFSLMTFGGAGSQIFSTRLSTNGGDTYATIESFTVPGSTSEFITDIDLTGDFNLENGKLKFEMTGGTNSTRFSNLEIEVLYVSTLTGQQGYRLLSSPVATTWGTFLNPIWTQGMTGSNFPGSESTPANVFTWNNEATTDNASNWTALTNLGSTISAGSAALVYVYRDDVYGETGSFPKTLSVSGTQNELPVNPTINPNTNGLTLVGNPIASVISWNSLAKSELSGVVYTWNTNDNAGTTDPSGNNPANTGTWISYNGLSGSLTDGLINPFQGFFVQTAGNTPTLSIAQGAESTGGSFYGKEQEPWHLQLVASSEAGNASTWLSFAEHHEIGKDIYDASQFQPLASNFTTLATLIGEELIDINSLPVNIEQEIRLPLVLESSNTGTFTFSVNELNLPADLVVIFEDIESGERIEITPDFTFETNIHRAVKAKASADELIARGDLRATATPSDAKFALIVSPRNITSVNDIISDLPAALALSQNYPNPFNPTTRVSYDLPAEAQVSLAVYDLLGRQVAVLVNNRVAPGTHNVNFDGSSLSSGIYVIRLEADGQVMTRKMTLLK